MPTNDAIRFIPRSADSKLSPVEKVANTTDRLRPEPRPPYVASTYVSIDATCPAHCMMKESGCYVRSGFTGRMSDQLDDAARHQQPCAVIYGEAQAIRRYADKYPERIRDDGTGNPLALRLHVGGDVHCERCLEWLARAADHWIKRGGGPVWTYTKRWTQLDRSAWGKISVLASCESMAAVRMARSRGYNPALTVAVFPTSKVYKVDGLNLLPCPSETKRQRAGRTITCVECTVCLKPELMWEKDLVVTFAAHGPSKDALKRRLQVILPDPLTRARN